MAVNIKSRIHDIVVVAVKRITLFDKIETLFISAKKQEGVRNENKSTHRLFGFSRGICDHWRGISERTY
ncbi:MAG: hypothetical protein ACE5GV_03780 [Candidatus Scalindua sp.]